MARILAFAVWPTALVSTHAFAACARVGSQLDCDWPGVSLMLGTQTKPARSSHAPGFAGPIGLHRTPAPGSLAVSLQNFSNNPGSCEQLGTETYCW